ncbi:MAG TPA: hypothetical protein VKA45_15245 [Gaiellaceae bacterium]|nr:hypothetical protein [Gaiellaceae bacterium]
MRAGEDLQAAAEVQQPGSLPRVAASTERVVEQHDGALGGAGAPRGLAGVGQPFHTRRLVPREQRRPLERGRRGPEPTAPARPRPDGGERGRGLLVRPHGGGREMPGTPVLISVQRARKRPVRGAPVRGRRGPGDGRAHQRVAEAYARGLDLHEALVLGRLESVCLEPHDGKRASHDLYAIDRGQSEQKQRATRLHRQARGPAGERALDACSRGKRVLQRLAPEQLAGRQHLGQLDEREWIAVRGGVEPIHHLRLDRLPDGVLDDAARRSERERSERHLVGAGDQSLGAFLEACRDDQRDLVRQ